MFQIVNLQKTQGKDEKHKKFVFILSKIKYDEEWSKYRITWNADSK